MNERESFECPTNTRTQKEFMYIYDLKPVINVGGLFSDGSEYYRIPQEPGIMTR